jgi:hypothetical protein
MGSSPLRLKIMKNFVQLKPFIKKSKKGFNGYPMASLAFYGPTNCMATKLVLGITHSKDADPELFKWFSEAVDIRSKAKIFHEVTKLLGRVINYFSEAKICII